MLDTVCKRLADLLVTRQEAVVMVARHQFGREAIEYIRSELSITGGLRGYLLQQSTGNGGIFAFLPFEPTDAETHDLTLLGVRYFGMNKDPDYYQAEYQFIRSFLQRVPNSLCLVQATYSAANWAGVAQERRMLLYRRNDGSAPQECPLEGWILLNHLQATLDEIQGAMWAGMRHPPQVAILTTWPADCDLLPGCELSERDVQVLADRTEYVLVALHDAFFHFIARTGGQTENSDGANWQAASPELPGIA